MLQDAQDCINRKMLLHNRSHQYTNQLVKSSVLQVIITKIITPEEGVAKRGFTCKRIGEHEVNAINEHMEEGRR